MNNELPKPDNEQLIQDVRQIKEALLGTLTNPNGALQMMTRIADDMYRPDDPKESVLSRLRSIENREQRRLGWMAAAGSFGGFMTWLAGFFFKDR